MQMAASLQPQRNEGFEWEVLNPGLASSNAVSAKRAVRLVQLRPQRELRLLLNSPADGELASHLDNPQGLASGTVAVKVRG